MLLEYPSPGFNDRLALASAALNELPRSPARDKLSGFVRYCRATASTTLAVGYVETFDVRRRQTLHLTYYRDGDTRRRGHSLARIKEIFRSHGWNPPSTELPDHLCVLLEFAGREPDAGEELLTQLRPGIELLKLSLAESASEYLPIVEAVDLTLPRATTEQARRAHALAATGPPVESVGVSDMPPDGRSVWLGTPGMSDTARRNES